MTEDALREEYRAGLARHGFRVDPDRDEVMFQGFVAYRKLVSILDRKLPYAVEPGPGWTPPAPAPEAGDAK